MFENRTRISGKNGNVRENIDYQCTREDALYYAKIVGAGLKGLGAGFTSSVLMLLGFVSMKSNIIAGIVTIAAAAFIAHKATKILKQELGDENTYLFHLRKRRAEALQVGAISGVGLGCGVIGCLMLPVPKAVPAVKRHQSLMPAQRGNVVILGNSVLEKRTGPERQFKLQ